MAVGSELMSDRLVSTAVVEHAIDCIASIAGQLRDFAGSSI
jgi:hypothetical protein